MFALFISFVTSIRWIDILPFMAAILVLVVCIPIQSRTADNLKKLHDRIGTSGSHPRSDPASIKERFIVDSDFLTAAAGIATFVATAIVALVAKDNHNPWAYATYLATGALSFAAAILVYKKYKEEYGIYKRKTIVPGKLGKKISLLSFLIIAINAVGLIGIVSIDLLAPSLD